MNLTCNDEVNQSVSANFSACSETAAQRPQVADPLDSFYKVAFGSAIFIYTVSLITILANSLLLLICCVDPLKIFRNPTTYFLIGLAIVDLLTALVQEPIYATCFILLYIKQPSLQKCKPFMEFASYFSAFSITVSLLIVFAFTVTQYIVVSSPLKYGRSVTKKKVFISVVSIYLYTAVFCCLPLMGVPIKVKNAIELFLHNYAAVLATIVFYILLHYIMKKKMATGNTLQKRKYIPWGEKTHSSATKLCAFKRDSSHRVVCVFRTNNGHDDHKTVYKGLSSSHPDCKFDDR